MGQCCAPTRPSNKVASDLGGSTANGTAGLSQSSKSCKFFRLNNQDNYKNYCMLLHLGTIFNLIYLEAPQDLTLSKKQFVFEH